MSDKEILNDLLTKCSYKRPIIGRNAYCTYFAEKLFKNDMMVFKRRSFTDLHKYYRRFGVSEKQLMRVLGDPDNSFSCYVCSDTNEFMFFLLQKSYKCFYHKKGHAHSLVDGKYTFKYLEELWDSAFK